MKLKINGVEFKGFSEYSVSLIFDSVASTFSFSALKDFAPMPFSYPKCEIENDEGELLITGVVLNNTFATTKKEQLVKVSGYSLPGALEDCQVPISIYPLQSDKLTLKEIVDKVLTPFGITYIADPIVSSDFNRVYAKSNAEPTESVKSYINRLASQKGIILTHNEKGQLVFTKIQAAELQAVVTFEDGAPGVFEMNLETQGQQMHSEITVMRQASKKSPKALQSTIINPYVLSTRPKTKILNADSEDLLDVDKAARNELGAELASAINLTIKTTKFVKPGNLVQVKSPRNNINDFTDFFVQSTIINGDTRGEKYILNCVLKDVYTDDEVVNIFDDYDRFANTLPKF